MPAVRPTSRTSLQGGSFLCRIRLGTGSARVGLRLRSIDDGRSGKSYHCLPEGNQATMIVFSKPIRHNHTSKTHLWMAELIAFEVEISFAAQGVHQKSAIER